jgi:predicted secreted hydrolase
MTAIRRLAALVMWSALGVMPLAQSVWKAADAGYTFSFPRDHASHPEYRIEWWYYTGNLDAADGRRFGYQVTFFRVGVDPQPTNPSKWAVRDLFMTHLAVTDVGRQTFRFTDRLNRAGIGWAGADASSYRVWNEDWQVTLDANGRHILKARTPEEDIGVDLILDPGKTPAIHGRDGISQKGDQPGNATHYYSLTRMPTRGTLRVAGTDVPVQGSSWMDHEFGTSLLEPDQLGWDWFSLQFDDGSELMVFQLRRTDGSIDPHSSGTWVGPDGAATVLHAGQFTLSPSQPWRASSGARYPLEWQVAVPGERLTVTARAAVRDQELRTEGSTGVTYWEGAIDIEGLRAGKPARGRGYLEMTGYTGTGLGRVLTGRTDLTFPPPAR